MSNNTEEWMKPEMALSRFKRKAIEVVGADTVQDQNVSTRYGYKVKDMGFLISENTLCEVVKYPEVYPLPNTNKWLRGLVNIRGNLVPVFDFSLLIGVTEDSSDIENLLVMGNAEKSIGVLIESVPVVCDVDNFNEIDNIKNSLNGLEDYIEKTYIDEKTNIIWLDVNEDKYFESVKDKVEI